MPMKKITPLFVIFGLGLIILIPIFVYYTFMETRGGVGLTGLLAGLYALGVASGLILERAIIYYLNISLKKIWLSESIIILLTLVGLLLNRPKFYFKVSDNVKWFAITHTTNKTKSKITYEFPNNKALKVEENSVILINNQDIGNRSTDIKASGNVWRGYQSQYEKLTANGKLYNCLVYSQYHYKLTDLDYSEMKAQLAKLNE
jgi:hypothetical protein